VDQRQLRIGVDARPLATPWNGIGTYLRGVFEQLSDLEDHQWFLYSDREVEQPPEQTQVTLRTGNTKGALLSTLFAQWQFPRWAKEDKCDLFWSPRHQLPLRLPRSMPTVLSIHDLVFRTHPQTMRRTGRLLENTLTPPSMRRATKLLTSSEAVRGELLHYYPRWAPKAQTVQLSSSLAEHLPPPSVDLRVTLPSAPFFVFSGSLEPRKNVDRLLAALEQARRNTDFRHHLVIISGGGWHNATTLQTIRLMQNCVHLKQNVSEAEKAWIVQQADFVALPSLHEGFGLPVAEGIKLGKPALTSNTAAMPEVAGRAGEYVDPQSVDSIAAGLLRLGTNPAHRASLSEAAAAMADRYSWQDCARQTLDVFKSALQSGTDNRA